MTTTNQRPLHEIAKDIIADWKPINPAARPYVYAMMNLTLMTDMYGHDSGSYVVNYFLGNAGTWRGEKARAIKLELNKMIKNTPR